MPIYIPHTKVPGSLTSADYGPDYVEREFSRLSPALIAQVRQAFGASRGARFGHAGNVMQDKLNRLRQEIELDTRMKRESLAQQEANMERENKIAFSHYQEELDAQNQKIWEQQQADMQARQDEAMARSQAAMDEATTQEKAKAEATATGKEVSAYAGLPTTTERYRREIYPPNIADVGANIAETTTPYTPVLSQADEERKRRSGFASVNPYSGATAPGVSASATPAPITVARGFNAPYGAADYSGSYLKPRSGYAPPNNLPQSQNPNWNPAQGSSGPGSGSPGGDLNPLNWRHFYAGDRVAGGSGNSPLPPITFDPNALGVRPPGYKNTFWQDFFGNKSGQEPSGRTDLPGYKVASASGFSSTFPFQARDESSLIPPGGGTAVGQPTLSASANPNLPGTTYNPKYGYQVDPNYLKQTGGANPEWPYRSNPNFNPGIFDKDFGYTVRGPGSVQTPAWNQIVNANFKTGPYAPSSSVASQSASSNPYTAYKRRGFRSIYA